MIAAVVVSCWIELEARAAFRSVARYGGKNGGTFRNSIVAALPRAQTNCCDNKSRIAVE